MRRFFPLLGRSTCGYHRWRFVVDIFIIAPCCGYIPDCILLCILSFLGCLCIFIATTCAYCCGLVEVGQIRLGIACLWQSLNEMVKPSISHLYFDRLKVSMFPAIATERSSAQITSTRYGCIRSVRSVSAYQHERARIDSHPHHNNDASFSASSWRLDKLHCESRHHRRRPATPYTSPPSGPRVPKIAVSAAH